MVKTDANTPEISRERVKELMRWARQQQFGNGITPDLLTILRWYQERHDEAGGRNDCATGGDSFETPGGPITPPVDASPGLSDEDERALSILAGFITHVEVFHSHPNFDPETRKALSHLRRRLSERKRVTREWVRQLVLSYANSVRNGDMNGPESMLRSIGVEVSE